MGDSVQRTLTTLRCLKCDLEFRRQRGEQTAPFNLSQYGYTVEAAFRRLARVRTYYR